MSDNSNFYLPKLSPEIIEEVRVYQSENRLLMEKYLCNGNIQYSYGDGYIIEENQEGNVVRILKMSQKELEELLSENEKLKRSFEPSVIRARRIKETGIH